MKCVRCGHNPEEDARRLSVSLDFNEIWIDGQRIRLGPKQCELMHILAEKTPVPVRVESIMPRLWYVDDTPDGGSQTLKVMISQLRSKLDGTAIQLHNHWKAYSLVLKEAV